MKEVQLGVIGRRLKPLDAALSGKQYLMGDKFSAADAYLFTVLNWTKGLKLDLSPWPNIKAYYERIGKRPKIQETMKAEGLA